jgi:hypothetical protein
MCMNRLNGRGCETCHEFASAGQRPDIDAQGVCTCPVCKCKCTALFFHSQRWKLGMQAADDREAAEKEAAGGVPQSTEQANSVGQFYSNILDSSNRYFMEQYYKNPHMPLEHLQREAYALTGQALNEDRTLNGNVQLRLALQREAGPLTNFVSNGKETEGSLKHCREMKRSAAAAKQSQKKQAACNEPPTLLCPESMMSPDASCNSLRHRNNLFMSPPTSNGNHQAASLPPAQGGADDFEDNAEQAAITKRARRVRRQLIAKGGLGNPVKNRAFVAIQRNCPLSKSLIGDSVVADMLTQEATDCIALHKNA